MYGVYINACICFLCCCCCCCCCRWWWWWWWCLFVTVASSGGHRRDAIFTRTSIQYIYQYYSTRFIKWCKENLRWNITFNILLYGSVSGACLLVPTHDAQACLCMSAYTSYVFDAFTLWHVVRTYTARQLAICDMWKKANVSTALFPDFQCSVTVIVNCIYTLIHI